MKSRLLVAVAIVLLLASAVWLATRTPGDEPGGIYPVEELEGALARGEAVLVFFTSPSCEQCQRLKANLQEVRAESFAAPMNQAVNFLEVDVSDHRNRALVRDASVMAVPTLLFFDREGNVQRFLGIMEADELRARLDALTK
jgi:thiol:disulfide interchange protein